VNVYWDTSALLNAVVSPSVLARLKTGDNWTRLHTLCEVLSLMTGRGVPSRTAQLTFRPDDCAAWLETVMQDVTVTELSRFEVLSGLKSAQRLGVKGRRVHDLMHAIAADKVKAEVLLTRDKEDFAGLGKAKVEWP
jgi:predicted nucleic acid-binding protein